VSSEHKFTRFAGINTASVTVTDITDGRSVSVNERASHVIRHPNVTKAKHPVKMAVKPHRA
jgi:hypothetical protein